MSRLREEQTQGTDILSPSHDSGTGPASGEDWGWGGCGCWGAEAISPGVGQCADVECGSSGSRQRPRGNRTQAAAGRQCRGGGPVNSAGGSAGRLQEVVVVVRAVVAVRWGFAEVALSSRLLPNTLF